MTIPIHPVVFVLLIFVLLVAMFAIGYTIGHNEGELQSAREIIILANLEMDKMKEEIAEERKHRLTHADLVQMETEHKNKEEKNA